RGIGPSSPQEHAVRRLEAIGRGYVDFALTEPGLFRSFCLGLPIPGPAPDAAPDLARDRAPDVPSDPAPDVPSDADPRPRSAGETVVGHEPAFGVLVGVLDELVATGVIDSE